MARQSCLDCVRKHIAQAMILADEAALGYPFHRWFSAGHLAEAESECRDQYPELAHVIREQRCQYMSDETYEIDFDRLMRQACIMAGQDLSEQGLNSKTFADH
jgi:hypothetical protein